MDKVNQQLLSKDQIKAFYHDLFVESQTEDFISLLGPSINKIDGKIFDIGGGAGFFAQAIKHRLGMNVTVLDSDEQSILLCRASGIDAIVADALNPLISESCDVVCFNLILHHLVGETEQETLDLQSRALSLWKSNAHAVFVNEYIYDSFIINDISGWLIYRITSNRLLSKFGRAVANYIPSLMANTFGVGVRFRSQAEWQRIFVSLGFEIVGTVKGSEEGISLARRLLLIKSCRRDSFLLKPLRSN